VNALSADMVEARRLFMAVAVIEHQQMVSPDLSPHDICEKLAVLWKEMQREAKAGKFDLDADNILSLNARVAVVLEGEPGDFLDRDGWLEFMSELNSVGGLEEDEGHAPNWIFAELYWKHLTNFRFATVWLLINALNLQLGRKLNRLSVEKLGSFLSSLSGAGPPISDGQTFYAQEYT